MSKPPTSKAPAKGQEEPTKPQRVWVSPAQRARGLGARGVRMPTGLEPLDKATRGGPLSGRVIVVGGAPGAGKTTLMVQVCRQYALAGHHVAILAADEDADGLLIRWGQLEGLSRDNLEEGNEHARENLALRLEELDPPLILVDQEEHDDVTLDEVGEMLGELAKATGRQSILMADSLQTVVARGTSKARDLRERADFVMRAAKRTAKKHGHLVILTSEMARGFYRSKKNEERIDPLAAFKESGGIEYGAALALALVNVSADSDAVDVYVAKNRMGSKPSFRIELDRARARFSVIDRPSDEQVAASRDAAQRRKVLSLVKLAGPQATKTSIAKQLGGRKSDALALINDMIDTGALVIDGAFVRIPA